MTNVATPLAPAAPIRSREQRFSLVLERTGDVCVTALEVADSWWTRFRGLQFRAPLAAGAGLLLVPCGSVHTCWVRGPIDVVGLDVAGKVVALVLALRPWRAAVLPRTTHAVLELPPHSAAFRVGDRLRLAEADRLRAPRSLAFLEVGSAGREDLAE